MFVQDTKYGCQHSLTLTCVPSLPKKSWRYCQHNM